MDPDVLADVDGLIAERIGPGPESGFPGAVLLVARGGIVVKHDGYGHAQTYRDDTPLRHAPPMRPDTVFDLASCTKVLATTAAVMHLADTGKVELDAPISQWIPGFSDEITVRRLLTHTAGLWEWQPTYLWASTPGQALSYIRDLPLRYEIGEGRNYSDLGFMLLGEIVRRASGEQLPNYVRETVHRPLGMMKTGFRPRRPRNIAATSFGNGYEKRMIRTEDPYPILGDRSVDDFPGWREHTLLGEVNDGNAAYSFDGVAGHAGLFGTARDVAVFAQSIANGGGYGDRRVFTESTVNEFTQDAFHSGQGLGFWTHRFEGASGLGDGGVGHSGFTGVEFAVDREADLIVVLLTNRLHPALPVASVESTWQDVLETVGNSLAD